MLRTYNPPPIISISVFLLIIFAFEATLAQKPSDIYFQKFSTEVNKLYRTSQNLVNGYIYYPHDSRIEGHPFFEAGDWKSATLFIDEEKHINQSIRYNLVSNEIILKAHLTNKSTKLIRINKFHIDSFQMGSHCFINSREFQPEKSPQTYYEQIFKRGFSYLRQYSKSFVDKKDIVTPYGKYTDRKIDNYIFRNGKMTKVNSRYAFLRCFSKNERKKIKKYMRMNNIRYKNADNKKLTKLLIYCHDFIND